MTTLGMCVVCDHEQRAAIDGALVRAEPERSIATKFKVSRGTLRRHRAEHLGPGVTQAAKQIRERSRHQVAAATVEHSTSLRERVEAIGAMQERIMNLVMGLAELLDSADDDVRAKRAQSLTMALDVAVKATTAMTANIKLLGQATGELQSGTQVTIQQLITSPDFREAGGAILEALRPYPEAMRAAQRALGELSQQKLGKTGRSG